MTLYEYQVVIGILIFFRDRNLLKEVVVVLELVSSQVLSHSIQDEEIASDLHNQKRVHIILYPYKEILLIFQWLHPTNNQIHLRIERTKTIRTLYS